MKIRTGNERDVGLQCSRVERLLRVSLSDWHGYLSREAVSVDSWQFVPWWAKRVPEALDKSWALEDLRSSIDRPGVLVSLRTSVDEICMSIERDVEVLGHPPDLVVLRDALDDLLGVLDGVGV